MGKAKHAKDPCWICGQAQPLVGKYHPFPWHITCDDDEEGRKKVAQWKKAQKKLAQAEIPTLALPD